MRLKIKLISAVIFTSPVFTGTSVYAQKTDFPEQYVINVNVPEAKIDSTHLRMGGTDRKGNKIAVNNYFLTFNGRPFIPVTGEFHFSRYPRKYWEEAIRKMKAGGINTIATYIFWNIHEEHEGEFNWSRDRDVRKFVELCERNGMKVIMRIGPFCHGEIRNGGIPDWILSKPIAIRSNDPGYLFYVRKLYDAIGQQLKGLYFKDGGPVIAVQLENEYQASAAPWALAYPDQPIDYTVAERDLTATHFGVSIASGKNQFAGIGLEHMDTLKSIALQAGIDVPIYTATGWGYAAVIPNETLPVTAAYAYPTWDKKQLSSFYLYKDMHEHPDYAPVRYKPEDYPVFAAELGAGIQITYSRRPTVPAKSVDALINRCLGSGANGIGYYMFHGGSTPGGDHYFYSDMAAGCPMISYDFQAPVGEYGQIRPSFNRLKLLHFFINDFGDLLAPMTTVLPENNSSIRPGDIKDLRYAARTRNGSGFIFLNNFQDDTIMPDKENIRLKIETGNKTILIPENSRFTLKSGENLILPFNFNMDGVHLNYATAQLLMKGNDGGEPYYAFFAPDGITPEFSFSGSGLRIVQRGNNAISHDRRRWLVTCREKDLSSFTVEHKNGRKIRVLVMNKTFALKSWHARVDGEEHLIISSGAVLPDSSNTVEVLSEGKNSDDFYVYPALANTPRIRYGTIAKINDSGLMDHYRIDWPQIQLPVAVNYYGDRRLTLKLPARLPADLNDIYFDIDFMGDTGMGFLNDELVADNFYRGVAWEIGLKRFIDYGGGKQLSFYFRPIYKNAPYLSDLKPSAIPEFGQSPDKVKINGAKLIPEYKTIVELK
ncbi:MAG TPA: beta-galactosidase [Chitinophagaceae bacterium]